MPSKVAQLRTQVAVIGAGPAGMLLAHLLHRHGVECLVIEARDRAYVEGRVRAGVLEQLTVDLLNYLGLGGRMQKIGLAHTGTNLACDGEMFRVDFEELTGGSTIMVYGQQEVMRDLFDAADLRELQVVFEAQGVELHDLESATPSVTWHMVRPPCGDDLARLREGTLRKNDAVHLVQD